MRAQLVNDPNDWNWSSYRATAGYEKPIKCLTVDWILSQFSEKRIEARISYKNFIKDGIGEEFLKKELTGRIILGKQKFIEGIRQIIKSKEKIKEVPRVQRYVGRPTLEELFGNRNHADKDLIRQLIKKAYHYGYTMQEIGKQLGVHYATVSRVLNKAEK